MASSSTSKSRKLYRHLSRFGQNGVVQPLLTDLYQITMTYAYWKGKKTTDRAVFDLYFRKNPFQGEFTIFAGLEECIKLLEHFSFSESDIEYLRTVLPDDAHDEFFEYLRNLNTNDVILYAIPEGSVVFPKVPLMVLEGPLPILQLLETAFLNLVNYASLVATNAARFRLAAGKDKRLLEFGLRRAQGPDGGLSASRYCYLGGFDGTSNVLAGKLYDIPVGGTHAHAFVTSYSSCDDVKDTNLQPKSGSQSENFVELCGRWLNKLTSVINYLPEEVNKGELAAFISYASAFPNGFLALIDTYDVIRSGLPNFCAVAMALIELGYKPCGVRLDSGDLAYLSNKVRNSFDKVASSYDLPEFAALNIVASNDINEDTIHSLNQQGHSIDTFGIGTHLVTCQKQPALGCVFKLVELNGSARMKLSEDIEKVTLPGRKVVYRCYGSDGHFLVDLMQRVHEPAPEVGTKVLCHHPVQPTKRAYVCPAYVESLYKMYWKNGELQSPLSSMKQLKQHTANNLDKLRIDHKRALNPTPYKVSVSSNLNLFIQDIWQKNAPIGELY